MKTAQASITDRTARGAALSGLQTIITKLVGIGTQIILAWILKPEDFGLAGLAIMAGTVIGLMREAGLSHVLMRRQRDFDRWANAAFWMSMVMGAASALLLLAAAPLMRVAYKAPGIAPLVVLLAVASPILSLSTVPGARLQAEMRFRLWFGLASALAVVSAVLSIGLALLGAGAASLIIPMLVIPAIRAVVLWGPGRIKLRLDPQFRRWRYLLGDTGWTLVATVLLCLVGQGDYMVLGLRQTPYVVGIYFFAFGLSGQVAMLSASIAQVLQPALIRLSESPGQQARASLRALMVVAVFCSPICCLQVVLASPFIHLMFTSKWYPAIGVFQILSAGMAVYSVGSLAPSLLLAQGRFRDLAILAAVYAGLFLTAVALGSSYGATGTATAVAAVSIVMGWVGLRVALRHGVGTWRDVAGVTVVSQLLAAIAVTPGWLIARLLPASRAGDFARLMLVSVLTMVIYLPLVRYVLSQTWEECRAILKGFLTRA